MRNLIKKILKESFEDVPDNIDWIKNTETKERYIGRPKRYTKNPTPMERLLIKLGLAHELNKPLDGLYSYGLGRFVSYDELNNLGNIGTYVDNIRLTTILLDKDLVDGKILVVLLNDLTQTQRLNIFKKLDRLGFKYGRRKPNESTYLILINPLQYNSIRIPRIRTKREAKNEYDKYLTIPYLVPYDANNLLNKL